MFFAFRRLFEPASALPVIVLCFLAAALVSARHIAPYVDEGMVFSPARNLMMHGHMGTSIIDETSELREGMSLRGINRYTYQIMPGHFLAQAAWYQITGTGLVQMRALSALCGIFGILAWFLIFLRLGESTRAALLASALIAVDSVFVVAGAFGRCDMLCAALSAAAIASYLQLRKRNIPVALLVGHCLAAASVFTHPAGILAVVALTWLPIYLDASRLRAAYVVLVALPYVAAAGGWGLYILQAPDVFSEQLRTNVAGRFYGISEPFRAIMAELQMRYLSEFGLRKGDGTVAHLKLIVLAVYVLGIIGVACSADLRRRKGIRALLLLAASNLVIFTFFEGTKQGFYLVHVIPLYIGLFAIWASDSWTKQMRLRPVVAVVLLAFVTVQLMRMVSVNSRDRFHNDFQAAAQFLGQHITDSQLVMASCELAFERGFDSNIVDDHRLGFFTGKVPDAVVIGERYRDLIARMKDIRPDLYQHVQNLLRSQYVKSYDQNDYQIYLRRH